MATLKKIIAAMAGIDNVIDSMARILTSKANHKNKLFWLQQSVNIVEHQLTLLDNGLQAAIMGRLHVPALTMANLTEATSHLIKYA